MAEGAVVLVTGPNGAGKTTLLRLLAGLVPLTSGEGDVLGHDLRMDRRAVRPRVGYLGHEPSGYDELTVRENLRFFARAAGRSGAEGDAALERVGLERVAGEPHGRLSAGQRRRVALAMVLARDARLLLLDEPHAGLDASGRTMLDEIVVTAPTEGRTVVLASHEADRARRLAQREVTMAGGRVAGGLVAPRSVPDVAPAAVEVPVEVVVT